MWATQNGHQGAFQEKGVAQDTVNNMGVVANWLINNKVESFTNRPIWPQGSESPTQGNGYVILVGLLPVLRTNTYKSGCTIMELGEVWNYGTGASWGYAVHNSLIPYFDFKLRLPHKSTRTQNPYFFKGSRPNGPVSQLTFHNGVG